MSRLHLAARAVGLTLMATSTSSCNQETGQAGELLEVECIGMARYAPLAGFFYLESPGNGRCTGLMSDTTWGGEVSIYTAQTFGANNGMTLQVKYGDETFTSRTGTVTLPEGELLEDRGSGEFDVIATNEAGESLRVRGPIDFCNYVSSEDCPYGYDTSDLPMPVAMDYSDGQWGARDNTFATDCRAVIDTATNGLQVDMQLGVWRGRNISVYQVGCDMPFPSPNSFRFRSGGVSAPGQYGPWVTASHTVGSDSYELPEMRLEVPLVYYGYSCLSDYTNPVTTSTSVAAGSSCEFEVQAGEPYGNFSISCTNARRQPWSDAPTTVDFTLDTPCVVITK